MSEVKKIVLDSGDGMHIEVEGKSSEFFATDLALQAILELIDSMDTKAVIEERGYEGLGKYAERIQKRVDEWFE